MSPNYLPLEKETREEQKQQRSNGCPMAPNYLVDKEQRKVESNIRGMRILVIELHTMLGTSKEVPRGSKGHGKTLSRACLKRLHF